MYDLLFIAFWTGWFGAAVMVMMREFFGKEPSFQWVPFLIVPFPCFVAAVTALVAFFVYR